MMLEKLWRRLIGDTEHEARDLDYTLECARRENPCAGRALRTVGAKSVLRAGRSFEFAAEVYGKEEAAAALRDLKGEAMQRLPHVQRLPTVLTSAA
jgi:hypothetical protein